MGKVRRCGLFDNPALSAHASRRIRTMRKASIAEMSAFVAIAERGSFARAATQLGVSRSSLSESLRALEERLGVRLLNRTTRSVALTEAGERLFVQLRPLLDNFDAALDSV